MVADWEHLYGQFPEYQLKRYGLKGTLEIIIITKLVDAYMRLIKFKVSFQLFQKLCHEC
jgi:hypothetical protein